MKTWQAVVPVAFLAILSGLAFRTQPGVSVHRAEASAPPDTARSSGSRVLAEDELPDTLDVLATSIGVRVDSAGLQWRARRYVANLVSGSLADHELRFLQTFFKLRIRADAAFLPEALTAVGRLGDEGVVSESDRQEAGRTLRRFMEAYFNRDALRVEHPEDKARLLAEDFDRIDRTELKLEVIRQAARDRNIDIEFLIATLPDPIDSYTGWQFDPMLGAITQAVAASEYVLDRFHFPDSDPPEQQDAHPASGRHRRHLEEPAIVIFRKHIDVEPGKDERTHTDGGRRLVLLLVHENPAAGVHESALIGAMRLTARWDERERERAPIRILAPTFSGSSESLANAIKVASRWEPLGNRPIRVISGSATDPSNKQVIERANRRIVTFHATTVPDDVLLRSLVKYMHDRGMPLPVAVLFEANTQYGRQMLELLEKSPDQRTSAPHATLGPSELIELPFPMNISRLRATVQSDQPAGATSGLPSMFRPLQMEENGNPADKIPQFNPSTSASYVELALAEIFQTLRRERVRTVALMATDPRDKLYLAQQIARHSLDVSIITAESDSLYTHPDYSRYLHGALVASAYPLYNGSQGWADRSANRFKRRQFANGSSQGIYNAVLALLAYDGDPEQNLKNPVDGFIDYGSSASCPACGPSVWITAVGRRGFWPVYVDAVPPQSDRRNSYTFLPQVPADAYTLPVYPSALFNALFIVLTVTAISAWLGIRAVAPRSERPPVPAGGAESRRTAEGRGYLLACIAILLFFQACLATLSVLRARAEWSWVTMALCLAAFAGLVALGDLARRTLGRCWIDDVRTYQARLSEMPRSVWSGAALMASSVAGAVAFIWYAFNTPADGSGRAVNLLVRATEVASGVSPTLPVLFLGAIAIVWGATELARLRAPRAALADETVHPIVRLATVGDVKRMSSAWALMERSVLVVGRPQVIMALLVPIVAVIFLFDPVFRPVVTIEGAWFDRFYTAALLAAYVIIGLALVQFVWLWTSLKRLLHAMALHPACAAYAEVPRGLFPPRALIGPPRLGDLATVADSVFQTATFQEEVTRAPDTPWTASATWRALVQAASAPGSARPIVVPVGIPRVVQGDGGVAVAAPAAIDVSASDVAIDERQVLVASLMGLLVRDALARLRYNLAVVAGGLLLTFCSHTLFPVQPQRALQAVGWTYIAVAYAAIVSVIVQIKRNPVIDALTSESPGKPHAWDADFVLKLVVFGLIPLLTLFAAQFPDIGAAVLRILEPVQKVLP